MRLTLWVSPKGLGWKVHWQNDSNHASFSKKEEAIKYARKFIGGLKEGTCSQIKVQKMDGQIQTEWTYGQDPFPPRG
jgi:hypothetical protein